MTHRRYLVGLIVGFVVGVSVCSAYGQAGAVAPSTQPDERTAITIAIETAEGGSKEATVLKGYTEKSVAKYQAELTDLQSLHRATKEAIEKEPDDIKKQQIAEKFYRKQKDFMQRMYEDFEYSDKKISELRDGIDAIIGGYSKAEGLLEKESLQFKAKEELNTKRARLVNDAVSLVALRDALPKNADGSVDRTRPDYSDFRKKEMALKMEWAKTQNALARCDRKLRFYATASTILKAHGQKVAAWQDYAFDVNQTFGELLLTLKNEMEILDDKISLGKLGTTLGELASIGGIAKDLDVVIKGLSSLDLPDDTLSIPDPPVGELSSQGITLEEIANVRTTTTQPSEKPAGN
jgi:hypothetical protein